MNAKDAACAVLYVWSLLRIIIPFFVWTGIQKDGYQCLSVSLAGALFLLLLYIAGVGRV